MRCLWCGDDEKLRTYYSKYWGKYQLCRWCLCSDENLTEKNIIRCPNGTKCDECGEVCECLRCIQHKFNLCIGCLRGMSCAISTEQIEISCESCEVWMICKHDTVGRLCMSCSNYLIEFLK
jgi:hypothetical protein